LVAVRRIRLPARSLRSVGEDACSVKAIVGVSVRGSCGLTEYTQASAVAVLRDIALNQPHFGAEALLQLLEEYGIGGVGGEG